MPTTKRSTGQTGPTPTSDAEPALSPQEQEAVAAACTPIIRIMARRRAGAQEGLCEDLEAAMFESLAYLLQSYESECGCLRLYLLRGLKLSANNEVRRAARDLRRSVSGGLMEDFGPHEQDPPGSAADVAFREMLLAEIGREMQHLRPVDVWGIGRLVGPGGGERDVRAAAQAAGVDGGRASETLRTMGYKAAGKLRRRIAENGSVQPEDVVSMRAGRRAKGGEGA